MALGKTSSGSLAVYLLAAMLSPARAQQPAAPDGPGTVILVRTTLVALDQANRTGNYTVLRDLGAPGFREANDAARLGQIFTSLRQRNLDLGLVTVIAPKLVRAPFVDKQGMLRVAGFFPSRPVEVNFDLAYQHVNGRWRLFGILVKPLSAKKATTITGPARKEAR